MSFQEIHEEMRRAAKTPRTLYEIGEEATLLDSMLESLGGDISDPEVAEIIDDWLLANTSRLENKVDGYCALIREYSARANVRREEAKRLRALIEADENRAKRLKERLLLFLEDHNIPKLETARFRVAPQNNGGALPLVLHHELDPETLPARFQAVEVTADDAAIRKALDAGEFLSFAVYGARGRHLSIR